MRARVATRGAAHRLPMRMRCGSTRRARRLRIAPGSPGRRGLWTRTVRSACAPCPCAVPLPRPDLRLPDERARLRPHGRTSCAPPAAWPSPSAEDADLIVFNTCSVREKAEQKLRSEVGKLAPLKRARPELVVAVAGCVAQQEGEKLLERDPARRSRRRPGQRGRAARAASSSRWRARRPSRAPSSTSPRRAFSRRRPSRAGAPVVALVTTMKGCDERCSFCVVPYTRGPERYRPAREIVDEVRRFVAGRVARGAPPRADRRQLPRPDASAARGRPGATTTPTRRSSRTCCAPSRARSPRRRSQRPALHEPAPAPRDRLARARPRRARRPRAPRAPAGAVGQRPRAAPHDPALHARRVRRARRAPDARTPGLTLSTDVIVGFPGETDDDFARDALARARGRLRVALRVQVLAAPAHAGAAPRRRRARGREERAARAPLRGGRRPRRRAPGELVGTRQTRARRRRQQEREGRPVARPRPGPHRAQRDRAHRRAGRGAASSGRSSTSRSRARTGTRSPGAPVDGRPRAARRAADPPATRAAASPRC